MSAIKSVLKEELARLEELSSKYRQEIRKLPKGSISNKERKGHMYAYLAYRKKGKVRFEYLGRAGSDKVERISKEVEARRRYEKLLKKAQNDLKELKRAINERRK